MKKKIKKILDASYLNPEDAKRELENLGYKYDKELSTPESKVFLDKKGRPNIAFRGSKRLFDDFLGSDLKLAVGLENYDKRFQEAKHLTKLVQDKYDKPANVFGSSLGGSLAEKSGANGKIITHNKGVGVFDIGKEIPKNQVDYRNRNDIVSLLSLTQNHGHNNLKEKETGKNPLDILGNHSIV
jgi:hypothetical protein